MTLSKPRPKPTKAQVLTPYERLQQRKAELTRKKAELKMKEQGSIILEKTSATRAWVIQNSKAGREVSQISNLDVPISSKPLKPRNTEEIDDSNEAKVSASYNDLFPEIHLDDLSDTRLSERAIRSRSRSRSGSPGPGPGRGILVGRVGEKIFYRVRRSPGRNSAIIRERAARANEEEAWLVEDEVVKVKEEADGGAHAHDAHTQAQGPSSPKRVSHNNHPTVFHVSFGEPPPAPVVLQSDLDQIQRDILKKKTSRTRAHVESLLEHRETTENGPAEPRFELETDSEDEVLLAEDFEHTKGKTKGGAENLRSPLKRRSRGNKQFPVFLITKHRTLVRGSNATFTQVKKQQQQQQVQQVQSPKKVTTVSRGRKGTGGLQMRSAHGQDQDQAKVGPSRVTIEIPAEPKPFDLDILSPPTSPTAAATFRKFHDVLQRIHTLESRFQDMNEEMSSLQAEKKFFREYLEKLKVKDKFKKNSSNKVNHSKSLHPSRALWQGLQILDLAGHHSHSPNHSSTPSFQTKDSLSQMDLKMEVQDQGQGAEGGNDELEFDNGSDNDDDTDDGEMSVSSTGDAGLTPDFLKTIDSILSICNEAVDPTDFPVPSDSESEWDFGTPPEEGSISDRSGRDLNLKDPAGLYSIEEIEDNDQDQERDLSIVGNEPSGTLVLHWDMKTFRLTPHFLDDLFPKGNEVLDKFRNAGRYSSVAVPASTSKKVEKKNRGKQDGGDLEGTKYEL
jgi:hypothetical protein